MQGLGSAEQSDVEEHADVNTHEPLPSDCFSRTREQPHRGPDLTSILPTHHTDQKVGVMSLFYQSQPRFQASRPLRIGFFPLLCRTRRGKVVAEVSRLFDSSSAPAPAPAPPPGPQGQAVNVVAEIETAHLARQRSLLFPPAANLLGNAAESPQEGEGAEGRYLSLQGTGSGISDPALPRSEPTSAPAGRTRTAAATGDKVPKM